MARRRVALRIKVLSGVAIAFIGVCSLLLGVFVNTNDRALASTPEVCESAPSLTKLVISRHNEFSDNRLHFSFSPTMTIRNASLVRSVAHALCALPKKPRGVLHCPSDNGISYRATFSTGRQTFAVVTIDPSGCEFIGGLGATRWAAHSPNLWNTLGKAMRLPKPDRATFLGEA